MIDTTKPSAIFQPTEGRHYTLTIALPGSIIAKSVQNFYLPTWALKFKCSAQSHELKTTLAGQIARALAVFCVDEVVVFDDGQSKRECHNQTENDLYTGFSDPNHFLMHLLSYLETPPHLRKHLFPLHPNLRTAGMLPSLDMPHHLRSHEWCQYREGVTVDNPINAKGAGMDDKKKAYKKSESSSNVSTALVDAGLPQLVSIATAIPPATRVTLKFSTLDAPQKLQSVSPSGAAVAPSAPRQEAGYYWGYTVRPASSLSSVFTECPFDGGYDLTFGTSERGIPLSSLILAEIPPISEFKHALIVFGGVAGLEVAVKSDQELVGMGVTEPQKLFDHWINLCPGQGSRTIRTEEAVWLGLMGLRDVISLKGTK